MADVKISAATDAGTLLSDDKVPVARNGDTTPYAATMAEVQAFALTTPASSGATNDITISSGNSSGGDSGDVKLQAGTASGTRGNVILDAPSVLFPGAGGALLTAQTGAAYVTTAGQTGSTASQWAGIGSGDSVNADGGGAEIYTGNTSGSGTTGEVDLHTGDANGTGNTGGVRLYSGNAAAGNSGNVTLQTGTASGTRGSIVLDAADVVGPAAPARLHLSSQTATGSANSGNAGIESGDATASTGNSGNAFLGTSDAGGKSGDVNIYTGASNGSGQSGGSINITSGGPTAGNANGGDISIVPANGVGAGRAGQVLLLNIPTADPHVVGAIWIDAAAGRVIKSSNG